MQRSLALVKPPFLLLLALGCSGGGAEPGQQPPGTIPATDTTGGVGADGGSGNSVGGSSGVPAGSTTGAATDGTPGVPLSPTTEACPTTSLPRTPLRRLTRFEYENTVRDLLNVDTSAVSEIPADEADGFDNNAALQVAPEFLVEKYVLVSEALAAQAVQSLANLTTCDAEVMGGTACAQQFAQSFGRLAFRRPITAEDEAMFMTAYAAGADGGSHAEGIEVMIRAALQSPHFLYRLETTTPADPTQALVPLGPFELATRLSYLIWGSGPDAALLDAAENGMLSSKEQVAAKARELLASPKSRVSLNNFLGQWAGLSGLHTMTKNTTLYPAYSDEVKEAMKRELPAFLDYMLANNTANLGTLFTSNLAFVSGPLAAVYGVAAPPASETTPQMVTLPEEQGRAGLLTQAGFLSVQGHPDQTSPVLRGKFVRSNLLCDPPPPPPDDLDISVPELSDGATARDRSAAHLSAGGACASCHVLMDPIGLAFEHFDAMGQYRTTESGQTIDVSGEVMHAKDPALDGSFRGVRELADKLAGSELVQDCVANHLFRFASGRFESAGDDCSLATLQEAFTAADGDLVELVVAMTETDAFLFRSQAE